MASSSATRDSSERERRQLTVMFCDLVNSTGLQQIVDDEDDYWDMVEDYFECCRQHIGQYGGEVQRYEGDGLLAYFGFPTADELAAQSAVRAALKIVDSVPKINVAGGVTLQVRVGIATGMVTIGRTRDQSKAGENAAQGLAPPLAARLLKLAEPGGIVVAGTTHDMVSSFFNYQKLGVRRLAGIREPQHAWLVTGDLEVESHSEAIHLADEVTPLIGRKDDLGHLLKRWQVANAGRGQAILISGEAGMGKSRIIRALLEQLGDESLNLLHFYGVQYNRHSALYPIAKQLERDAQIRDDDSTKVRHEKLERLLAQETNNLDRKMLWYSKLLSLPAPDGFPDDTESPERQQQEIIGALLERVVQKADRRPLIIVFEDLHWIDQASLDFVDALIDAIANLPVLILLTHRRSFRPQLHDRPQLARQRLRKLDGSDRKALIMEITGHKNLPPAVLKHIVDKTDGIPLYVEEFTKSVLESDVLIEEAESYSLAGSLDSLSLPNSLRDSLMSRLDRLSTDTDSAKRYKEIAQTCAAIGRQFSFELLSAVSAYGEAELMGALRQIEGAQLIFRLRPHSKLVYLFKHALVQEEAYRSISNRKRKSLHVRIAEVLERQFPSTKRNEPELIAHHYTEGGLAEHAVPYWLLAGEQAGLRAAHAQAVAHLQMSLKLIGELPAGEARDELELNTQTLLGLSLAASRGYGIPEVQTAYERARMLCDRLESAHPENFSIIQSGLVTYYILRAKYDVAIELSEQFVANAERVHDPSVDDATAIANYHIDSCRCLGISRLFSVDLNGSRIALERCVDLFEQSRAQNLSFVTPENPAVAALSVLPLTLWLLGKPDEAVRRKMQALDLAESLQHPFNIAFVHCWSTVLHQWRREPQLSAEHARAAVEICDEHGFDGWSRVGKVHLSIALGSMGKFEDALSLFESVRAQLEGSGTVCFKSYFLSGLAETLRLAGQIDLALEQVQAAMDIADGFDERFFQAELYRQRASFLLCRTQFDLKQVEEDLLAAVDLARRQEAKSLELRALVTLCRLLERETRGNDCLLQLNRVYDSFDEGLNTGDLMDARALLSE